MYRMWQIRRVSGPGGRVWEDNVTLLLTPQLPAGQLLLHWAEPRPHATYPPTPCPQANERTCVNTWSGVTWARETKSGSGTGSGKRCLMPTHDSHLPFSMSSAHFFDQARKLFAYPFSMSARSCTSCCRSLQSLRTEWDKNHNNGNRFGFSVGIWVWVSTDSAGNDPAGQVFIQREKNYKIHWKFLLFLVRCVIESGVLSLAFLSASGFSTKTYL